jgi:hypothetical protein
MEIVLHWISEHGFDLLGSFGLIASLAFTTLSFRKDESSRRIGNLLELTAAHRDIWSQLFVRPELARILEPDVDLVMRPVTNEEALFMTLLLLHLNATWQALDEGVFRTRQAVARDIRWFFSLPIPKSVWEKSKAFQDPAFAQFVEECRR